MGLIKAALGAAGGVMADQWLEYFYCEAIPENVMAVKGLQKRTSGTQHQLPKARTTSSPTAPLIAVADGQCMIIVDQGKVTELCAEPGEFIYDSSTEPSIFYGKLGKSILDTFKTIGKRFTFGGEPPKDQRVYYFNTKELIGNKYGTPSPVPFRVVDQRAGIDIDIAIRCFGEYSYRICDPILFYTNVCGNVGRGLHPRPAGRAAQNRAADRACSPRLHKISEHGHPLQRAARPHDGDGRRAQRGALRASGATCAVLRSSRSAFPPSRRARKTSRCSRKCSATQPSWTRRERLRTWSARRRAPCRRLPTIRTPVPRWRSWA